MQQIEELVEEIKTSLVGRRETKALDSFLELVQRNTNDVPSLIEHFDIFKVLHGQKQMELGVEAPSSIARSVSSALKPFTSPSVIPTVGANSYTTALNKFKKSVASIGAALESGNHDLIRHLDEEYKSNLQSTLSKAQIAPRERRQCIQNLGEQIQKLTDYCLDETSLKISQVNEILENLQRADESEHMSTDINIQHDLATIVDAPDRFNFFLTPTQTMTLSELQSELTTISSKLFQLTSGFPREKAESIHQIGQKILSLANAEVYDEVLQAKIAKSREVLRMVNCYAEKTAKIDPEVFNSLDKEDLISILIYILGSINEGNIGKIFSEYLVYSTQIFHDFRILKNESQDAHYEIQQLQNQVEGLTEIKDIVDSLGVSSPKIQTVASKMKKNQIEILQQEKQSLVKMLNQQIEENKALGEKLKDVCIQEAGNPKKKQQEPTTKPVPKREVSKPIPKREPPKPVQKREPHSLISSTKPTTPTKPKGKVQSSPSTSRLKRPRARSLPPATPAQQPEQKAAPKKTRGIRSNLSVVPKWTPCRMKSNPDRLR